MPDSRLICLFPCHTLDDFPTHLTGGEADGLLAFWTGLWHPSLVATAGTIPVWRRADSPGYEFGQELFAIPSASHCHLPIGWREQAELAGAPIVSSATDRGEFVELAQSKISAWPAITASHLESTVTQLDNSANRSAALSELEADFLAFGYCRLQVELLTRRMRYTSTIDDARLRDEIVAAANAWRTGDVDTARQRLQAGFDLLLAARQYFYPVESYLIDLALVWPTTAGAALRQEIASGQPINLLMTGETLDALNLSQPDTIVAIRDGVSAGSVCLVGGEFGEPELPLLLPEQCLKSFQLGRAAFEKHVGQAPTIYGRRRAGLNPALPQILSRCGFQGAIHCTLDDGHFPGGNRAKIRWEGYGMSSLDAIAASARDVGRVESMLGFYVALGDTMDNDHVATMLLARWPGGGSLYWNDLKRAARYAPVLGQLITLTNYFSQTDSPGQIASFAADRYRSPYLQQAIIRKQPNPLSSLQTSRRESIAATCYSGIDLLTKLVAPAKSDAECPTNGEHGECSPTQAFAAAIPRAEGPNEKAILAVNASLQPRQMLIEPSSDETLMTPTPVAIDIPPMGFTRATESQLANMTPRHPVEVADNSLSNEFLQVVIHPETGGIKAIYDDRRRGNRLSQQIAFREPDTAAAPGEAWREPEAIYSTMKATSIEIVARGPWLGEIRSRGKLIGRSGDEVAKFVQRTRLVAASRLVEIVIQLDEIATLRADPWNSYVAVRWAWSSDNYRWHRSVCLAREETHASRFESPDFVQLESETGSITILPGGLPCHVRCSDRRLDTLIQVRGESSHAHRLAIGFHLPNAAAAALAFESPATYVAECAAPLAGPVSSWMFHLSAKNIVATWWSPIFENGDASPSGFRVRLAETIGQGGAFRLQTFRPISEARQVDFTGQPLVHLNIEDGKIVFDIAAREWVEIEAIWRTAPG